MTNKQPACGTDTGLPTIENLHTKAVYLHGIMSVLTEFEPHDKRTSNGAVALAHVVEGLADEIVTGMEKLMDAKP